MNVTQPNVPGHGFAPGKLLLFGEHSVVYGAPAVGFPISRGVTAHLSAGTGQLKVTLEEGLHAPETHHAVAPEELVRKALGTRFDTVDVHLHLAVPPMCGFGTSAAVAVALLKAGGSWNHRRDLWDAALRVEQTAHTHPSGVDPAIVVWEQPVLFQRPPERPTIIEPLAIAKSVPVLMGWCGHHGGARVSITGLSVLKERHSPLVNAAMATLSEAANLGADALREGDLTAVGLAANLAHGVLAGLGLVDDAVEQAVRTARRHGALGAKMSGAGGAGGAWLAIFDSPEDAANAAKAMRNHYPGPLWLEALAMFTPSINR